LIFVNVFCSRKTLSTEKLFVWINYVNILIRSRRKGRNVWIIPSNCGIIVDNFVEIRPSESARLRALKHKHVEKVGRFLFVGGFRGLFCGASAAFWGGSALGQ